MTKIILFNGPPSSGKDTAAFACWNSYIHDGRMEKFSRPIKDAFLAAICVGDKVIQGLHEENKESIIEELGVSYRQWQIDFSEKFMKPLYGNTIFARLLLDRINVLTDKIILVSDCGFQIEIDTLAAAYLPENIALVSLYRRGCDFSNDSREYVKPLPGMFHFPLVNNGTDKAKFESDVVAIVKHWLETSP